MRRAPSHTHLFLSTMLFILAVSTPAFASTISFDQCANCGNPNGNALQVILQPVNPPYTADLGFINNTFSYDPAALGAITTINASVDKDFTISQAIPFTGSFASNFRPLIEQSGNFYVGSAISGPIVNVNGATSGTSGYSTISGSGLVASNFTLFDFTTGTFGSTHPDLSASGAVMKFGVAQLATINNNEISNATIEVDYDNLSFTINDPVTFTDGTFNLGNYSETPIFEVAPTPEPSTMLLLGSGLIGLAGYGKKKFFKR